MIPAGLPHGSKDLFHRYRKMVGSQVRKKLGLEAAREALDHSASSITAKHYIDPTKQDQLFPADHMDAVTIPLPVKKKKRSGTARARRSRGNPRDRFTGPLRAK